MYVCLYLSLCLLCSEYQRHLARWGPEVYIPGYIRAFFQSKTEQIQERQDETLICNLKFVFLSIISLPLIIMNPLVFSLRIGNWELVGHQGINWHDWVAYLYCIMPFVVLKETTFSERPRTGVKRGTNSIQGMRRSKTHRDLPQASLKEKDRKSIKLSFSCSWAQWVAKWTQFDLLLRSPSLSRWERLTNIFVKYKRASSKKSYVGRILGSHRKASPCFLGVWFLRCFWSLFLKDKKEEKIKEDISTKRNRLGYRGLKGHGVDWRLMTTAHRSPNFPCGFLLCIGLPVLWNSWHPVFSSGFFNNFLFPHLPCTHSICSFSKNLWFDLLPDLLLNECASSFSLATLCLSWDAFFLFSTSPFLALCSFQPM